MTTRRPFFRGGVLLLTSEVWGVQELCSARIASRWSADTDFGRRGAVPTAGVVVVSFLGGEGVGKVKPAKMCQTKKSWKSANTWEYMVTPWGSWGIRWSYDIFSPTENVSSWSLWIGVKDLKLSQDEEDVNSLDGHGGSAWSRVSSLQCCWGPGIPP